MKILLLAISLSSITQLSAQFYEFTEDRGYNNRFTNVLNVGDTLWVYSANYNFGTVGDGGAYLLATDTMGTMLWQHDLLGEFEFNTAVLDIVLTPDNEISVFRGVNLPCDVIASTQLEILKLDLGGNVTANASYEIDLFWWNTVKNVLVFNDQLVLASGTVDESGWGAPSYKVFSFDASGSQLLWTTNWYEVEIDHIARYNDSIAVFSDDQLVILDDQGMRVDSLSYSAAPLDVATFTDGSLIALWSSGVYELNANFELQPVIPLDDEYSPNTILIDENDIHLWDGQELNTHNSDFEILGSVIIDVLPYFNKREVFVNGSTLAIAGSKSFDEIFFWSSQNYQCGSYSLYNLASDTAIYQADVAVRHLEFTEFNANQVNEDPVLFSFSADVGGYVVNTGEEILTNVNLNYMGDPGICGVETKRVALSDIFVFPGDSIYFTMQNLSRSYVSVGSSGTGTISFCVFASEPSNLYDRDETNDKKCASAAFGVGIEEDEEVIAAVFPNPASDQLRISLPYMNEPAQIQFLDARGALISEEQVNRRTNLEFSVSDWPAGLYLARVVVDGRASAPVKFSVVK